MSWVLTSLNYERSRVGLGIDCSTGVESLVVIKRSWAQIPPVESTFIFFYHEQLLHNRFFREIWIPSCA